MEVNDLEISRDGELIKKIFCKVCGKALLNSELFPGTQLSEDHILRLLNVEHLHLYPEVGCRYNYGFRRTIFLSCSSEPKSLMNVLEDPLLADISIPIECFEKNKIMYYKDSSGRAYTRKVYMDVHSIDPELYLKWSNRII